ncbi:MAG: hypothetical protein OEZ06_14040 [Myxococcales bacterium]|nr:hypothetical protein [Myxococcales bacterium]
MLLIFGTPGYLLAAAAFPDDDEFRPTERLLMVALLGVVAMVLLSTGLIAWPDANAFGGNALWIAWTLLCAGAGWSCWKSGFEHRRWLGKATDSLRSGSALGFLALIIAVIVAHALRAQREPWLYPPVSYYYLRDIVAIVEQGSVPTTMWEYGTPMEFETNKIGWYLTVAAWLAMTGQTAHHQLTLWLWVFVVLAGTALGVFVYLRSLTKSALAATFGSFLVLALPRTVSKLSALRGECFGILLLFPTLWLLSRALRAERHRGRWVAVTALSVALLLASHLVPAVIAALTFGGVLLSHVIRQPRSTLRRVPWLLLAAGGGLLIVQGMWAAGGKSPLHGQGGVSSPTEIRPYLGYDPTQAFRQLARGRRLDSKVPRYQPAEDVEFFVPPAEVAGELRRWFSLPIGFWPEGKLYGLLPVALLLLCLRSRHQDLADHSLALLLTASSLLAMGLFFSYRYHTYLPAFHPERREFAYLQLLTACWTAPLVDAGLDWAQKRHQKFAWTGLLAALLVFAAFSSAAAARHEFSNLGRGMRPTTEHGRAALAWLQTNTPADSLIMPDGSSDGVFAVLAKRRSLTEGRAPYFQPANLLRANATLRASMHFFWKPSEPVLRYFGVDYVIVGSRDMGSRRFYRVGKHRGRLKHLPYLKLEQSFGPVDIFRVLSAQEKSKSKGDKSGGD